MGVFRLHFPPPSVKYKCDRLSISRFDMTKTPSPPPSVLVFASEFSILIVSVKSKEGRKEMFYLRRTRTYGPIL